MPVSRIKGIATVFILTGSTMFGQTTDSTKTRSTAFSGDLRAEFKLDDVQGDPQGRPRWIQTVSFTPHLTLPFVKQLDILLQVSSLENTLRQPFNRFNLRIRRDWGNFTLGDANPVYSKLTLNGILVRGGSMDIQLGLLRLAAAYGQTRRTISGTDSLASSYKRMLYGLKIGVGRKTGSRLYFNAIQAEDRDENIPSAKKTPQENLVVGLDGALVLFDNRFSLSAEIDASGFNSNKRSREIDLQEKVPSWIRTVFIPRLSSEYDFAGIAESKVTLKNTTLTGTFRHIGASFHSLGTSYLHNDRQSLGLSGSQRLWTNRISLSGGLEKSRDNLAGLKSATTNGLSSWGNTAVTPKSLPSLTLGFRTYSQKNQGGLESLRVNTDLKSISGQVSHRFRLFAASHSLSLSYSQSWYRNRILTGRPSSDYDSWMVRFSLNSQPITTLTVWGSLGLSSYEWTAIGRADTRGLYQIGITHSAFKGRLTSNFKFSVDEGQEKTPAETLTGTFEVGRRSKWNLSAGSDLRTNRQTLSFRIERVVYENVLSPEKNYQEWIAHLVFTRHFGASLSF